MCIGGSPEMNENMSLAAGYAPLRVDIGRDPQGLTNWPRLDE